MLVAADNTCEVHPQCSQRAGVLCCVDLVSNLFNTHVRTQFRSDSKHYFMGAN